MLTVFNDTVARYVIEYGDSKNDGPALNEDDLPCLLLDRRVENFIMTFFS